VPIWEQNSAGALLNSSTAICCEMIVQMAEAKRDLIWIQTAFFMGWGCNVCYWKDFIPRDVPTLLGPSAEARQAFQQHTCEKMSHNNRNRRNPYGRPHYAPFHRLQSLL
jgi:hypothetical protein